MQAGKGLFSLSRDSLCDRYRGRSMSHSLLMLGSGKLDFARAKRLVEERLAVSSAA
jgi:hypothetical protein